MNKGGMQTAHVKRKAVNFGSCDLASLSVFGETTSHSETKIRERLLT